MTLRELYKLTNGMADFHLRGVKYGLIIKTFNYGAMCVGCFNYETHEAVTLDWNAVVTPIGIPTDETAI